MICVLSKSYEQNNNHYFIFARVKIDNTINFYIWKKYSDFIKLKFVIKKVYNISKKL